MNSSALARSLFFDFLTITRRATSDWVRSIMSVPVDVQTFLASVRSAYEQRNVAPDLLAGTVRLDTHSHDALRASLQTFSIREEEYGKLVSRYTGIADSERIHSFIVSLLVYITHNLSTTALTRSRGEKNVNRLSSADYTTAYAAWAQVYSRASLVFQAQETPYFGPTLRVIGIRLVLLAIAADSRTGDLGQPSVTDAVSKISRTTGVAAIDRSPLPGEQTKRSEVLWLANASFRCYFKLKNIRLCETVLGSVENALTLNRSFASAEQKEQAQQNDAGSVGMMCYSRADKVTYRYYLGRLRLSQQRIRAAYEELRWAFDNCTNTHMANKNLILTHLAVSAIILGIYPSYALLHASNLTGPFADLIRAIQAGDGRSMYAELDKWRAWHRHHGHYLLLKEKLEIGVWRNLLRRSFLITRLASGLGPPVTAIAPTPGAPAATKTPPPVLKLANFLTLARKAWQDDQLAIDDVECAVASLIDQGYVKAYAMHSSGNVVFRRTADFGFVKMSTVY